MVVMGSSTQRALTWKSLCVPSSEFGTHRVACFQSKQFARALCRSLDLSEFVSLARQFACYQMSFFHSLFCLVMVVYIVTVILTAVLCCL